MLHNVLMLTHPITLTHIDDTTIHQEPFRVQYLAQGHFNMWTGGSGGLISGWPCSTYWSTADQFNKPLYNIPHRNMSACRREGRACRSWWGGRVGGVGWSLKTQAWRLEPISSLEQPHTLTQSQSFTQPISRAHLQPITHTGTTAASLERERQRDK